MSEFQKNDVVVEILDMERKLYVISDVNSTSRGYALDSIIDGIKCYTYEWKTFEKAHTDFVKVGVWDKERGVVEDE